MAKPLIIPSERLRGGAPSAYGSMGYEVVRDGWSVAVFRARRENGPRGELQPPTKDALAVAKLDAELFAAMPDLVDLLRRYVAVGDKGWFRDGGRLSLGATPLAEQARKLLAEFEAVSPPTAPDPDPTRTSHGQAA
jgi:hypothetical protein